MNDDMKRGFADGSVFGEGGHEAVEAAMFGGGRVPLSKLPGEPELMLPADQHHSVFRLCIGLSYLYITASCDWPCCQC